MSGAPAPMSELGQTIFAIAGQQANKYRVGFALERLVRLRAVLNEGITDPPAGFNELMEAIDLDLAYIESQLRSVTP